MPLQAMKSPRPVLPPSPEEIVAPEGAEWPISEQEEGQPWPSTATETLAGAPPPSPPQSYRPGPAEVRCVLSAVLARLAAEHANLEGLVSSMDLTAHPRASESLQALLLARAHFQNTWNSIGAALGALRF